MPRRRGREGCPRRWCQRRVWWDKRRHEQGVDSGLGPDVTTTGTTPLRRAATSATTASATSATASATSASATSASAASTAATEASTPATAPTSTPAPSTACYSHNRLECA
ncbi:unnamed protein product [Closterium sp. NIES-54]